MSWAYGARRSLVMIVMSEAINTCDDSRSEVYDREQKRVLEHDAMYVSIIDMSSITVAARNSSTRSSFH